MLAIAIDDEQLMLYALEKAVKASEDIEEVVGFSSCDEALDWLEINTPDVAFVTSLCSLNEAGMKENQDFTLSVAPVETNGKAILY